MSVIWIILISSKTPLEGDSWVERHLVRVSKATVARRHIGVPTRSISLITDGFSGIHHTRVLDSSVWRSIHVR